MIRSVEMFLVSTLLVASAFGQTVTPSKAKEKQDATWKKIFKTDYQWQQKLTDEQFRVTRKQGTELAFSWKYWDYKGVGTYQCVCCGLPLFHSKTKFKSGTGWPSFYDTISKKNVGQKADYSGGSIRTEVVCNRCDAHLGHVFNDGPRPTGKRFCINSAALKFKPVAKTDKASK